MLVTSRLLRTAAARLSRGYHAPVRDMKFLLYEVHDFEGHHASLTPAAGEVDESDASQPCDREMVEMVIESTQVLCENELAPLLAGADSEGCTWVDKHHVKTPAGFKEAYQLWYEAGWQGLMFPPKYGGQGMPASVGMIQGEMTATANYTWTMFPGLSKGAINTLLAHGSNALKDKYLPPLVSGEFTGTMCLTEPQCGSDLGQVTTKAVDNGDGTYSVSGTKIFISCGEHDMASNIIHCVLARLPDAPEGTKGISLFLVPKKSVDESGAVGEHNGVSVSRIEDKMGCHGSPTCQVEFEGATGWLIGEPNRGLNHMFTFINTSRIGTAVQGVAAAELAFQNTLWYTKERGSMRALSGTKAPSLRADPIIWHPSVRTMLLTQKAVAEGGRSMVYECAKLVDKMDVCEAAGDTKGAKAIDERLAFLTPILKGFLTEVGKEAADLGIQAYGGHGYIKDNKAEQIFRDVRIAALWEGTTQIQALDLLGRKIMLQKLKPIGEHCSELRSLCMPHLLSGNAALRGHAWSLMGKTVEWQLMTYRVAARASSNKEWIGHSSVDYLMYGGYVTLAAHWLKMEAAAVSKLASGAGEEEDAFYQAKIHTSAYVFDRLLIRCESHKAAVLSPIESVMAMPIEDFSFDHSR